MVYMEERALTENYASVSLVRWGNLFINLGVMAAEASVTSDSRVLVSYSSWTLTLSD